MKRLELVLLMFYFQFEFCIPETTKENKGYCLVEYTYSGVGPVPSCSSYVRKQALGFLGKRRVEEPHTETYQTSYFQSEQYRCGTWRNCWRSVPKYTTNYRTVLKPIPRTRIECCAGYQNVTVHENVFQCEPICDPPCIKGHCSTPGNCTCFQGYEHRGSSECVPVCQPKCENGHCASPGQCECNHGYGKINGSYCAPQCSQECINGKCHRPEECLCNTGYKNSPENTFHCEPICDELCINSTCTGFNECTCWDKYTKHSTRSNVCTPICILECLHGECTSPDACTCHEGYYLNNGSINICEPECNNCTNGFCTAPNECVCNLNYTLNQEGYCEPLCQNCSNGKCIVPYECECFEGYQKNGDGDCIPFCNGCENGNCSEPNVCTCFEGYENSANGECFPACEYGCFAGECIAPNNCSCQEYDRVEDNVCFPLQGNYSNSTSENVAIHRSQLKFSNSSKDIDFSSLYIKVKCSFEKETKNSSNCEINNSSTFLLECSTIKSQINGFKLFCLWSEFSSEISDLYEENLPSVAYIDNENSTFLKYETLDMTILLPKDIVAEDGNCYVCPCEKKMRAFVPGMFNLLFSPCRLSFESSGWFNDHAHFSLLAVILAAVATIAVLVITALVLYLTRRIHHQYIVHTSSEQVDDLSFPLTPQEQ